MQLPGSTARRVAHELEAPPAPWVRIFQGDKEAQVRREFRIESLPMSHSVYRYQASAAVNSMDPLAPKHIVAVVERRELGAPLLATIHLPGPSGSRTMEVLNGGDGHQQVLWVTDVMGHRPCPEKCQEGCSFSEVSKKHPGLGTLKEWEFKCKLRMSLNHTNFGRNSTCNFYGNARGPRCKSDSQCEGDFGQEQCQIDRGLVWNEWAYCRCATKQEMKRQVEEELSRYDCHGLRRSRKVPGSIVTTCRAKRKYALLRQHEFLTIASTDHGDGLQPLYVVNMTAFGLAETPFAEQKPEALEIFSHFQAKEHSGKPFGNPVASLRWHSASVTKRATKQEWSLSVHCPRLEQAVHPGACDEAALLLLSLLAHVEWLDLDVPKIYQNFDGRKPWPKDPDARCGAPPARATGGSVPSRPHWDPTKLGHLNDPTSVFPCTMSATRILLHDMCKCADAGPNHDGVMRAWCYVDQCEDCLDPDGSNDTSSCVDEGRPWAYCYGDGYAPNRPINGLCPSRHECTGRPYNQKEDWRVLDLNDALGRPITGAMTRIYEPMLGQHEMRQETSQVNYTYCIPLGPHSRWLFTSLYVPGQEDVTFRHDIPLSEQTVGFSTDIFCSFRAQDVHLKLDAQMYSAWDGSYIDGVIWFDMLQPYGDREVFPMQLPFVHVQRRFKSCFGKKVVSALNFRVCLAYTQHRDFYLSMRATLFGVSLPFSREMHLATAHVEEQEGRSVFTGLTLGSLEIQPENVTYYMRETKERTTWELTKMIVELERRISAQEHKEEALEKTMEARMESLNSSTVKILNHIREIEKERHLDSEEPENEREEQAL